MHSLAFYIVRSVAFVMLVFLAFWFLGWTASIMQSAAWYSLHCFG